MKHKTIRFLGIPLYKSREKNGIRKKYFLGICYNKKNLSSVSFVSENIKNEQGHNDVFTSRWYVIYDAHGKDITDRCEWKYKHTIPTLPDDRNAHICMNINKALQLNPKIKKIALVFFMGIGDYFYATNFIKLLKEKYPSISFDAYVSKNMDRNNSPLVYYCLQNNPNIDNVYYYDGKMNEKNWKKYDYTDVLKKVYKKTTLVLPVIYEYSDQVKSRTDTLCKTFCLPVPEIVEPPIIYPNKQTSLKALELISNVKRCYRESNRPIVYMQLASRSLNHTYPQIDKLIEKFISNNYIVVTAEKHKVSSPYVFSINTNEMNINDSIEFLRIIKEYNIPVYCCGIISCFASVSSGLNIPNLIIQSALDKQIESVYYPNNFIISHQRYSCLPASRVFVAPRNVYQETKNTSGLRLYVYDVNYIYSCFDKMISVLTGKNSSQKIACSLPMVINDSILDTKWFLNDNHQKTILIIKTDHIGDHLLFRNFMEEIKKSEKYKDCIIHFIGNEVFQEISELLDKDIIDKSFWVKHKLPSLPIEEIDATRERLFNEGLLKKYDLIFFPGFNRNYFEDCYFRLISGISYKELVCNDGAVMSQKSPSTKYNGIYTRIIHLPKCYEVFEFDMNKHLIEEITEEKNFLKSPYIEWKREKKIKENYIVITLFSRNMENRWHPFNYVELIKWLKEKYQMPIYIIGSKEDEMIYNEFSSLFSPFVIPFFGQSWQKVISLINDCQLYIGPDSGCYHLSVCLNKKTVVISRGVALYRFNSYPERSNLITVFPEGLVEEVKKKQQIDETYIKEIFTSTNLVSVKAVKNAVQKIMEI